MAYDMDEGQAHEQSSQPDQPVLPPMDAAPNRWRLAADTAIKHPYWASVGGVLGVVGLALSVFQIWQSYQTPPEDLVVGLASIGRPESIRAEQVNRVADNEPMGPVPYAATPIDLTLKNNGGQTSTITEVIADVKHFEILSDCTGSGAGEAGISAEYQIKIPAEPTTAGLGQHKSPVHFEVKPGSVDRMSLTIGPDISTFYNYPYVVGANVKLVHGDGSVLDAGSFTFVTNLKAVQANLEGSRDASCARRNLDTLETIYAFQSIKSTELDQLRRAYQDVLAGRSAGDGDSSETPSTGPTVEIAPRTSTPESSRVPMPA